MKLKNTKKEQIFISAGEYSGDNLGCEILSSLLNTTKKKEKKIMDGIHFFGNGGAALKSQGVEILHDIDELSVVGITEIFRSYNRLSKITKFLAKECKQRNTKVAILIDFPGFHLKLGKQLKEQGIKTILISSPQIWGWRYSRVKKIRKSIDTVLCFYPFEKDIYLREKIHAEYIGHPLLNKLETIRSQLNPKKTKNLVALLPGSRTSEINRMLPEMLLVAKAAQQRLPKVKFEIGVAHEKAREIIQNYELPQNVSISKKSTYELIARAFSAIACSGTVTMECAWFRTPFLLMYKASAVSAYIARRMMTVAHLGIINILNGREITKEFLQEEIITDDVLQEVIKLQTNLQYRKRIIQDFLDTEKKLGAKNAPELAALFILELLKTTL